MKKNPIKVLSIAGSDPSGGAGIQADLKTFAALDCYGSAVITALTAQNTQGVQAVFPVEEECVAAQLHSVLSDIEYHGAKTGMLYSSTLINKVTELLRVYQVPNLVIDPVIYSKNNATLLQKEAIHSMIEKLFPLATVVTPNLPEAETLLQRKITNFSEMENAANSLLRYGMKAVILKGGHLELQDSSSDLLMYINAQGKKEIQWFHGKRIATQHTHGTGCTFAAALTCALGLGFSLKKATEYTKNFITRAIIAGDSCRIGKGIGPVWPTRDNEKWH